MSGWRRRPPSRWCRCRGARRPRTLEWRRQRSCRRSLYEHVESSSQARRRNRALLPRDRRHCALLPSSSLGDSTRRSPSTHRCRSCTQRSRRHRRRRRRRRHSSSDVQTASPPRSKQICGGFSSSCARTTSMSYPVAPHNLNASSRLNVPSPARSVHACGRKGHEVHEQDLEGCVRAL